MRGIAAFWHNWRTFFSHRCETVRDLSIYPRAKLEESSEVSILFRLVVVFMKLSVSLGVKLVCKSVDCERNSRCVR